MTTNPYGSLINGVIVISILLFAASLVYAYRLRTASRRGALTDEQVRTRGYILIGLWVLLPPIWFFAEFQLFHPNMFEPNELARIKQSQELARNIWLAFVVVLAAMVGIKWPP